MGLVVSHPLQWDAAVSAAIAIEFAALDRNALLRTARKAEDLPHRRIEHLPQGRAIDVVAGTLGGAAQDEFAALHHVVPSLDAVRPESVADPEIGGHNADPGIFAEVEGRL